MTRLTAAQKREQAEAAVADERIARVAITGFYDAEVAKEAEKLAQARAAVAKAEEALREAEQRRDAWTATGQLHEDPFMPVPEAIRHHTFDVEYQIGRPILEPGGHLNEAARTAYEAAHAVSEATDRYLTAIGHPKPDYEAFRTARARR